MSQPPVGVIAALEKNNQRAGPFPMAAGRLMTAV
jgi:hypothetical protein